MYRLMTLVLGAALALTSSIAGAVTPLRLATTTSTDNSGLLDVLLPKFKKATGISVHVIAVGTGKALRLGANGDVDVLLVHAPPAEMKYMHAGHGVNRRKVMYNDFVIVGPASDPAGIKGGKDAVKAFEAIAQHHATFVSRGDDSGTNKKELILWKDAHIKPSGKWYRAAGQGMGKVLQIAGELNAYTLTDRGTWLAYEDKVPLKIVVQGDARLFNPYHVIAVNPNEYSDVDYTGAMQFIAWLTSVPGQREIRDYRLHGKQLFHPTAITKQ
ncbi:MAG TPA: substrate-binding domain-containing protein [Gammaproteobacteria bacterium]|nr:substrate-binding domain-containing protein [Gammaproteobacteria bacterium]